MITHVRWSRGAIAASLLSIGSATFAVPTTYFGEDLAPEQTVPAGGGSLIARQAFEAKLATRQDDGLEGGGLKQDSLPPISLFNGSAQLTMANPDRTLGRIENVPDLGGAFQGRFNTTPQGKNWWQANTTFEIFFAQQTFSAFGFYGTDFGDFVGNLTLELLGADRSVLGTLDVPASGNGTNNGSLLFFGFTDAEQSYNGVRFLINQTATDTSAFDTLGFDDFTAGKLAVKPPPPNGAPEPGSLALVGASLFGLALARCRRRT